MPKQKDVLKEFEREDERRRVLKAKKYAKRNRAPKPPRRTDWLELADADWDEVPDDVFADERIMPRDERERRMSLESGVVARDQGNNLVSSGADTQTGIVVEVSTGLCSVLYDEATVLCSVRGSLTASESGYTNVVAVGDVVQLTPTGNKQGVIEGVLRRRSRLIRPDPADRHLRQVVAANVDQLLVVAALRNPPLWPELVDRQIIAARLSDVAAILCVNKLDLVNDPAEVDRVVQVYSELGIPVVATSAARGDGLAELREVLSGRTTVLAGLSGVGKSTLLSAIEPGFQLRTGQVNTETHQGRHTTTQVTMLPLGADGYVVDTPGIKEYGLVGVGKADLAGYYPELRAHVGSCRFSNCLHDREPGCAVRSAMDDAGAGRIRYESYLKILATLD